MPERYEVRVRYPGATRRRVWWRRRGVMLAQTGAAPPGAPQPTEDWPALRTRRRRWAELLRRAKLLRRVFAVDVERCPRGGGEARLVGFVTEPAVAGRILAPLAPRGPRSRATPATASGSPRTAWT